MSATLNFNEPRYFSWKGVPFHEITAGIKKNGIRNDSNYVITNPNLFRALPLNIYRKEIASNPKTIKTCNTRTSIKIQDFDMPGGTIISETKIVNNLSLDNVIDLQLTQNKSERPGTSECNKNANCFSQETNALRRVRSSGMIRKKFNVERNNDTYYTNSSQYLVSRNRTFQQNQFHYIRQGNPLVKPGSALSKDNVYSAQGMNHCARVSISAALANNTFQYTWIDSSTTLITVTIPDGQYDLDGLNSAFTKSMLDNGHYYIKKDTNAKIYLMAISYNTNLNKVLLQTTPGSTSLFPALSYTVGGSWTNPSTAQSPTFAILSNGFQFVVGFSTGSYGTFATAVPMVYTSTNLHRISPAYIPTTYKPNNSQFATQGAVSSSSLVARLKYNAITDNGYKYMAAYGKATANALAYGVPEGGYTLKDKIGYPIKCTPVFPKSGGAMRTCPVTNIRNQI